MGKKNYLLILVFSLIFIIPLVSSSITVPYDDASIPRVIIEQATTVGGGSGGNFTQAQADLLYASIIWNYNQTLTISSNFNYNMSTIGPWAYNQTSSSIYYYNQTLQGFALWVNKSGDTMTGNLTIDGASSGFGSDSYIFSQPITGSIGSGIIWANGTNQFAEVQINCSGLGCSYGAMKVRLVNTTNTEKYCNVPAGFITLDDNTHNVLYISNTCTVSKTSIQTYITTPISPGGIADFGNIVAYGGDTELVNGIGTENKRTIKLRKLLLQSTGQHLSVISGFNYQTNSFPRFNITSGSNVYLMDIVPVPAHNNTVEYVSHNGLGGWQHVDGIGLNITACDTGTSTVTCSNQGKFRRHYIFMIGNNDSGIDGSEIHQLLPSDTVNYDTIASCMDTITTPLTYTLPDYYQYSAVMLWAYCGKTSEFGWVPNQWIDLRTVKSSGSSAGTSGVNYWTLGDNNLTTLQSSYIVKVNNLTIDKRFRVNGLANFTDDIYINNGTAVSTWLYNWTTITNASLIFNYNQTLPSMTYTDSASTNLQTNITDLNTSITTRLSDSSTNLQTNITNVNASAVHKMGAETIYGTKSFMGEIFFYNGTFLTAVQQNVVNGSLVVNNLDNTPLLVINTSAPSVKALLNGNMNITGNLNVSGAINVGGVDVGTWLYNQTIAGFNYSNIVGYGNWTGNSTAIWTRTGITHVGIGTTTPSHTLNVIGNTNITGNTWVAGNFITGNGANYFGIESDGDLVKSGTADYLVTTGDFAFRAKSDEDAGYVFSSGGNNWTNTVGATIFWGGLNGRFGIGTANPASELNVIGNINTTIDAWVGDDLFIVDQVGIGTTTPNSKLNVYANVDNSAIDPEDDSSGLNIQNFENTNVGVYAKLGLLFHGTDQWYIRALRNGNNDGDLEIGESFGVGAVPKLTIKNNGNVGIETSIPTHTLTVNGSTNITGDLFNNGFNFTAYAYNQTLTFGNNWTGNSTAIWTRTGITQVGIGTATPQMALDVYTSSAKPIIYNARFQSIGTLGSSSVTSILSIASNGNTNNTGIYTSASGGATNNYGIYASVPSGAGAYAGFFNGNVTIAHPAGGVLNVSNRMRISMDNASVWNGRVVCYVGAVLGHCTSVVGVGGACTCVLN